MSSSRSNTSTFETSVVSSTDLYIEAGDAPGRQGAKSEHIGHM